MFNSNVQADRVPGPLLRSVQTNEDGWQISSDWSIRRPRLLNETEPWFNRLEQVSPYDDYRLQKKKLSLNFLLLPHALLFRYTVNAVYVQLTKEITELFAT